MSELTQDLSITELRRGYREGKLTARAVLEDVCARAAVSNEGNVWIRRLTRAEIMTYVEALERRSPSDLPLYGIPFAIKDNIDLARIPTTAACGAFAYEPTQSASVVQKLIDAGAIPIGKTNLDQFATGLVGVRSPYGACGNSFDPSFISGGSSSGSAVAVASGLVSFALGTDTAGSGRVPAAFNNIVGLKPSCGLLSTTGVVPACRSLDAVSIFALTAADVREVLDVAQGFDPADPFSKRVAPKPIAMQSWRFGVPRADQLEFFGDADYRELFARARERLAALGGVEVEIDFAPFLETARLLYEGPWVAERYAAIAALLEAQPDALFPVTRQIIEAGARLKAVDAFRAQYRLKALERTTSAVWRHIDVLLTPTAGTIYRIADVNAEPIRLNSNLGIYTNFVNLLDLAAVAVPTGFRSDGMPFGVTLVGRSGDDHSLLAWAARLHHASVATVGALHARVPEPPPVSTHSTAHIPVVVCGAHMSGLPLNHQLQDRGARLVRATQTAAKYRFYALPGGPPKRPGLVRVAADGAAIAVEVWSVPQEHFGSFVAGIPAPLGIGKVELGDGTQCPGFICEAYAVEGAQEITALGGWRDFIETRS
jgi:allophanate hydrolase